MKKITFLITILVLCFNSVSGQTVFGWDSAGVVQNNIEGNGAYESISETIDGITVTLSTGIKPENWGPWGGLTANVIQRFADDTYPVTFVFDQPVVVNSIILKEANGANMDYTFTPTGRGNSPVTAPLISGDTSSVNLNWMNVTSFTVTATEYLLNSKYESIATKRKKGIRLQLQKIIYNALEVFLVLEIKNNSEITIFSLLHFYPYFYDRIFLMIDEEQFHSRVMNTALLLCLVLLFSTLINILNSRVNLSKDNPNMSNKETKHSMFERLGLLGYAIFLLLIFAFLVYAAKELSILNLWLILVTFILILGFTIPFFLFFLRMIGEKNWLSVFKKIANKMSTLKAFIRKIKKNGRGK